MAHDVHESRTLFIGIYIKHIYICKQAPYTIFVLPVLIALRADERFEELGRFPFRKSREKSI